MERMIFNETNIFILSKLAAMVKQTNGRRYRLSSEESILALLKIASDSQDDRIQGYYHRFLENLTAEQILLLMDHDIHVPAALVRKPGILPEAVKVQYSYVARYAQH
jgi:hypothetical protein